MMERDRTLGLFVREARRRKGLTQASAAKRAGVSRRHYASLESGANVTLGVLKKVAPILEITEIPLGGNLKVVEVSAAMEVILDAAEEIAKQADRLRLLGVSLAIRPRAEMPDTELTTDFVANVLKNIGVHGKRLETAARHAAVDAPIEATRDPAHKPEGRASRKLQSRRR
jgi:transcriptional regulator with XRE-family HTH domain